MQYFLTNGIEGRYGREIGSWNANGNILDKEYTNARDDRRKKENKTKSENDGSG